MLAIKNLCKVQRLITLNIKHIKQNNFMQNKHMEWSKNEATALPLSVEQNA